MDYTNTLPQVAEGANAVLAINEAHAAASPAMVYARDAGGSSGLVWAWMGGRWGGTLVPGFFATLTASTTSYMVVDRADGAVSISTTDTNWLDTTNYCRAYLITTGASSVTDYEDHRAGPGGSTFGGGSGGGSGGAFVETIVAGDGVTIDAADPANPIVSALAIQPIIIACSDETTNLTAGTAKVTFRMPYAMTLTDVRASVNTAPAGSALQVDINEGGASILSTKLTIDNGEKTSVTAAAAAVISDALLASDAEITIDLDAVGSTTPGKGLKVTLIGTPA
jgi:hypothetical protein